jgi:AcrR family transcriptional regulator
MRTRGWQGDPPATDDEARARIIDATMRCVEVRGPTKTGLSDVAAELGVTRQTVYRYFPSTEELLTATAMVAVEPFLDRLVAHCSRLDEPDEVIVEALAYCIERVPKEPHLSTLLATGRADLFTGRFTGPEGMAFGRALVRRFPVDWHAHGFDDAELDELVGLMLRVLQSFVLDPGRARTRAQRRAYLRRWVGPAVRADRRVRA